MVQGYFYRWSKTDTSFDVEVVHINKTDKLSSFKIIGVTIKYLKLGWNEL